MSTYLYLWDDSHNPPLPSQDEVGSNLSQLPEIIEILNRRQEIPELFKIAESHNAEISSTSDIWRRCAYFIRDHPHCTISVRDEYDHLHFTSEGDGE